MSSCDDIADMNEFDDSDGDPDDDSCDSAYSEWRIAFVELNIKYGDALSH